MDFIKIAPKTTKIPLKNDKNPHKKYKIPPTFFPPKKDKNPPKKTKSPKQYKFLWGNFVIF